MQMKQSAKTSTAKGKRNLGKERTWRKYITDHAASGLSAKTFCQIRGLNVNNFGRWRQEIARRDREVPVTSALPAANPFVPVRVIALPLTDIGLEVLLPGNAVIKVTDDSPLKLLARVLRVLEVQC